jgi:hypothetical protein
MNNYTPMTPVPQTDVVMFHRRELAVILSLYGQMVAMGEWRDYGISTLKDYAVFSVFRRTAENPLYRIEKHPKLRNRQGEYCVIGMDGQILKRGHDLKTVLRVFDRKRIRAV